MADMPTPGTAGRISRSTTRTTEYALGGYRGTLTVADKMRPKISVKANTNSTTDPIALQPMDVEQLDSLITILCALRDELLRPGSVDPEAPRAPRVAGCLCPGCVREAGTGKSESFVTKIIRGAGGNIYGTGAPTADCPAHCTKDHDHVLVRSQDLPMDCPPYCTKHNHEEMGG